jgi:hypothetical protein
MMPDDYRFMFERRGEPIISRARFASRMATAFAVTVVIVIASLAIGMVGYHFLGGLAWIDALLNSAMILTGMGPVDAMQTTGGKLFASFYALYSGIAFLTMMAVLLAPIIHRALHKFHIAEEDQNEEQDAKATDAKGS